MTIFLFILCAQWIVDFCGLTKGRIFPQPGPPCFFSMQKQISCAPSPAQITIYQKKNKLTHRRRENRDKTHLQFHRWPRSLISSLSEPSHSHTGLCFFFFFGVSIGCVGHRTRSVSTSRESHAEVFSLSTEHGARHSGHTGLNSRALVMHSPQNMWPLFVIVFKISKKTEHTTR